MRLITKLFFTVVAAIFILGVGSSTSFGKDDATEFSTVFPKKAADISACGGEFSDARATLKIKQGKGETRIRIKDAAPLTLYTAWLRFAGGTSPLTGKSSGPVANPNDIEALAVVTPDSNLTQVAKDLGLVGDDGTGSTDVANGFFTDKKGRARFDARLRFPLIKGAYPYQEFDVSLNPLALQTPDTSNNRVLSIVSHCSVTGAPGDGHGLVASTSNDPAQAWFDLVVNPFDDDDDSSSSD